MEMEVDTIERYFDQEVRNHLSSSFSVHFYAETPPRIQRFADNITNPCIMSRPILAFDLTHQPDIYPETGTHCFQCLQFLLVKDVVYFPDDFQKLLHLTHLIPLILHYLVSPGFHVMFYGNCALIFEIVPSEKVFDLLFLFMGVATFAFFFRDLVLVGRFTPQIDFVAELGVLVFFEGCFVNLLFHEVFKLRGETDSIYIVRVFVFLSLLFSIKMHR